MTIRIEVDPLRIRTNDYRYWMFLRIFKANNFFCVETLENSTDFFFDNQGLAIWSIRE